jgi:hypothetical protein
LNQAGIDLTLAHPTVIEKLLTLSAASDHAHHLGQSLDELVRHHPPLRSLVLAGLLRSLQAACDEGAAFAPTDEEERKKYLLNDTDVVGKLDIPAENEPLKKLVMILNVSIMTDTELTSGLARCLAKQYTRQRVYRWRWS